MAPPGIVTRFGNAEIIQYPADRNMAFRIVLSDLIGISLSLRINSNGHFPRIVIAFFRISRASFASRSCRRSRAISFASSLE